MRDLSGRFVPTIFEFKPFGGRGGDDLVDTFDTFDTVDTNDTINPIATIWFASNSLCLT